MIIQIVNLTYHDVFKTYSNTYNIYRDVYQKGLLGLELREVPHKLAESVQKIVLKEKQICYKNRSVNPQDLFNLFIPGSTWDFKELSRKVLSFGAEDLGYKIINVVKNFEEYDSRSFAISNRQFNCSKPYVMGILNVTPDSFSDGGIYTSNADAVKHALNMFEAGADIVDIGGESTRPGSQPVPVEEELHRVMPVLEQILIENPDAVISVDTTKSKVAEEALKKGAKIINDISAGAFDPGIFNTVKEYDASMVLMHMKGTPATMQVNPFYDNVVCEVYDFLFEKCQIAAKTGIKNIIIDPGIGFGKRQEDNLELIKRLEDFKSLGYPILIGTSRKGFIGKKLGLNINERETATAILEAVAIKNGARIIRTHNVNNGKQAAALLTELL